MTQLSTTAAILTGLTEQHLQQHIAGFKLHIDATNDFNALCLAAADAGIRLKVVSAFRSFERQSLIWQQKITGIRPVFDMDNRLVDLTTLTGFAKLEAILLYSALPGASRHHWGTEVDLYDIAAVDADYTPSLSPIDYAAGGKFYPMVLWLQQHAVEFGFFMPYQHYTGGVAAEPWHLSYSAVADRYQEQLTCQILEQCLLNNPIAEQPLVLAHLTDIHQRFVQNICR